MRALGIYGAVIVRGTDGGNRFHGRKGGSLVAAAYYGPIIIVVIIMIHHSPS